MEFLTLSSTRSYLRLSVEFRPDVPVFQDAKRGQKAETRNVFFSGFLWAVGARGEGGVCAVLLSEGDEHQPRPALHFIWTGSTLEKQSR